MCSKWLRSSENVCIQTNSLYIVLKNAFILFVYSVFRLKTHFCFFSNIYKRLRVVAIRNSLFFSPKYKQHQYRNAEFTDVNEIQYK